MSNKEKKGWMKDDLTDPIKHEILPPKEGFRIVHCTNPMTGLPVAWYERIGPPPVNPDNLPPRDGYRIETWISWGGTEYKSQYVEIKCISGLFQKEGFAIHVARDLDGKEKSWYAPDVRDWDFPTSPDDLPPKEGYKVCRSHDVNDNVITQTYRPVKPQAKDAHSVAPPILRHN